MTRLTTALVALGAMALGATGGAWYGLKYAEERYGHLGMEQIYRESAQEIKIYTTLLRFTRNGENERSLKLLEGLVTRAESTLTAISSDVPEQVRLTVGIDATDHLKQYRAAYPAAGDNAP